MVLSEASSRQANIETNNRALAALGLLDEPLIPPAPKARKKHSQDAASLWKERDQSARSAFLERARRRKIAEAARV